ncbi:hypothetical protein [Brevibacterium sp. FME37]|uniref:hypothetical protein n=1 Tax=Brevibacterium sp. FME37 TaxID=2742607 RepID=UPI001865DC52|nr:hypothetical protein [Brevibacterium sp. FME37]
MAINVKQVLRIGFFADGVFKALVAVAMLTFLEPIKDYRGTPVWLLLLTAMVVSVSAVAEIVYSARNGAGTHTKYLVAYDAGWVLFSAAAVFLTLNFGVDGWTLWLSYQLFVSPIIAVVFVHGSRCRP